jgi:DNA polymerase III sliding clamp (beta) subunit (PCNA family)
LGNIGGSKISMEIGDKVAPVLLKPKEGKGYTHIIMPLKI